MRIVTTIEQNNLFLYCFLVWYSRNWLRDICRGEVLTFDEFYQKVSPNERPEMFSSSPSGLSYMGMGTSKELEEDFKYVDGRDLDDNEFLQCRQRYMAYLSQMMNNSSDFAMLVYN